MYRTTVTFTFIKPLIVTFIVNDTVYQTVKVKKNETVAKPVDPEGDFLGWYLNDAEYDFTTPVTKNITLTAKIIISDHLWPTIISNTGISYSYSDNDAYVRDILIHNTLERFSSVRYDMEFNNDLRVTQSYPYGDEFVLNNKNYTLTWIEQKNQTRLRFEPAIKKSDLKTIKFTYIN